MNACVRDYDPGFDDHISRLVINSVFAADSSLVVSVSNSKSITDNTSIESLDGVTVELFEDGQKIENLSLEIKTDTNYIYTPTGESMSIVTSNSYTSDHKASAGKTYSITASKEDFETITAITEVPNHLMNVTINTDNLTIEETTNEYESSLLRGEIFVDIIDAPNEKNFYEFKLYSIYIDSNYIYYYENDSLAFTGIQAYRNESYITVSDGSGDNTLSDEFDIDAPIMQFSDVTFDGTIQRFILKDLYLNASNASNFEMELEVRSISEAYYNYFTSYNKQSYNQGNFLAEPVIVYSNIENGYGIFAGYTSTVFPIDF